jgi:hypothetical protein
LILLGVWIAAWLGVFVGLSTRRWTSPTEPPIWPLHGLTELGLLVAWVLVPGRADFLARKNHRASASASARGSTRGH